MIKTNISDFHIYDIEVKDLKGQKPFEKNGEFPHSPSQVTGNTNNSDYPVFSETQENCME